MTQRPDTPDTNKLAFVAGDNCWCVAQADQLGLIVDGADYFTHLRAVMAKATRQLLLIGWDFDFEIEMCPGESDADGMAPDGLPNHLGPFIEALVERAPDLHIYLLKWNGAAIIAPGRILPAVALAVFGSERVHFALDGHHPFGACHHQKIVVADDQFAFCGGIDMTEERWDTSEHLPENPKRVRKDGTAAHPWHDVTSALSGPVAAQLGTLARERWLRAKGETLTVPDGGNNDLWPEALNIDARDTPVAISRTLPPYDGTELVDEIEQLYLQSIQSARHSIYIESQYFSSDTICAALRDRLTEHGGPEVIVINPKVALSQFEDASMHATRERILSDLCEADHENRFHIFYPVTAAGDPIYVHAKVMIVDDVLLHLGSSNINNRSMGFDTECDVSITRPAAAITRFRDKLIAEHLGVAQLLFSDAVSEHRTLIQAISTLNGDDGRRLIELHERTETIVSGALADTRLMDPRFRRGDKTRTGSGVRPRHVAALTGAALIGFILWRATRG